MYKAEKQKTERFRRSFKEDQTFQTYITQCYLDGCKIMITFFIPSIKKLKGKLYHMSQAKNKYNVHVSGIPIIQLMQGSWFSIMELHYVK